MICSCSITRYQEGGRRRNHVHQALVIVLHCDLVYLHPIINIFDRPSVSSQFSPASFHLRSGLGGSRSPERHRLPAPPLPPCCYPSGRQKSAWLQERQWQSSTTPSSFSPSPSPSCSLWSSMAAAAVSGGPQPDPPCEWPDPHPRPTDLLSWGLSTSGSCGAFQRRRRSPTCS